MPNLHAPDAASLAEYLRRNQPELMSAINEAVRKGAEIRTRPAIVAAARSWLGTPYHHAADIKGVGVDCAMLLVRVFCDLGLVPPFDPRPYVRDWMLHRSEEKFAGFLLARAQEVGSPEPGDVVLFRVGRCFAHGGIVTQTYPLIFVHASSSSGCVVEEQLDRQPDFGARPRKFFAVA